MRELTAELEALDEAALRRRLRVMDDACRPHARCDGRPVLNFSSNDYLGLAAHPSVISAHQRAVERWGVGSGASRLVTGTQSPHLALEETLAWFKGTEAALVFSSGYAAAVGTLTALLRAGDIVILDKLSHASLIDGARLSGATVRTFLHNDLSSLENRLHWAQTHRGATGRVLVVTESVFSMDGDRAPLTEIVALKERYQAWLLVDEAHAFGLIGRDGRGLAEACGVAARVDFHFGTLSKAAGVSGGYVATTRVGVDLMINRARSFIYSTAPAPALAATAEWVLREVWPGVAGVSARDHLWSNLLTLTSSLGLPPAQSAIIPIVLGDERLALQAAADLLERGFLVPAIRYPTVARGRARLRLTLSAAHAPEDVRALALALAADTESMRASVSPCVDS
jgi:8-amino-7-oxononanoate synthase